MIRRAHAVALALFLATPAASAATPDAVAAARAAFDEGRAAMKTGDVPRACPKLEEAERLDPNVGYAVNLARCEELRNALVKAREYWQEALDLARARHDARTAEVEKGLRSLDARVPRVIVTKPRPYEPGLVVHVDDIAIDPVNLNSPIPVNPGSHQISATAPEYRPWSTTLTLASGSHGTTVAIPALDAETGPGPVAGTTVSEHPPAERAVDPGTARRTIGIVAMAVGAVGLGIGAGFAVHAHSQDSRSKNDCKPGDDTSCSQAGVDLRGSAQTSAGTATGAVVAGAIVAAGGLVLWLTAPKKSARAVGVSPAGEGLAFHGRF